MTWWVMKEEEMIPSKVWTLNNLPNLPISYVMIRPCPNSRTSCSRPLSLTLPRCVSCPTTKRSATMTRLCIWGRYPFRTANGTAKASCGTRTGGSTRASGKTTWGTGGGSKGTRTTTRTSGSSRTGRRTGRGCIHGTMGRYTTENGIRD